METFFQSNIYVLFGLIVYYLLLSEKPKKDNQKISVLYIFIAMLSIFDVLDLKYMLMILLLCLFVYFEFLIDDDYKIKIIRKISFKTIDFLYLIIIKYNLLLYITSLIFISDSFTSIINIPYNGSLIIFLIIFIFVIRNIIDNEFELYSFSEIYHKMNQLNFGNFKKIDYEKIEILTFIEDKSFFERKNDYTFLCWDFLKYRLYRINEVILKINDGKGRKHKIRHICRFILYIFKQLYHQLKDIKGYKKHIRGYSTIDMQLFRTISVKNGYEKIFHRKIIELVYSQLFFKGLKAFYKINYKTVSDNYFKHFIIANYIKFAPICIGDKYTYIEKLWQKSVNDMNNSEFLLSVLCLSGKLNIKNLNLEYMKEHFFVYMITFSLDEQELNLAIKNLKKQLKS